MKIEKLDAVAFLQRYADDEVAAIVTDPPYASGATLEAGKTQGLAQGMRDSSGGRWFEGDDIGTMGLAHLARLVGLEARRLLRPGGSFVWFCDWRMVPALAPSISSTGLRWVNLLVWDKCSIGMGNGFRHQHELALHFVEDHKIGLHFSKGKGVYHSKSVSNVLRAKRVAVADRRHPCEKPSELLEKIVEVVTDKGDLLLDPFAGSGAIVGDRSKTRPARVRWRQLRRRQQPPRHVVGVATMTGSQLIERMRAILRGRFEAAEAAADETAGNLDALHEQARLEAHRRRIAETTRGAGPPIHARPMSGARRAVCGAHLTRERRKTRTSARLEDVTCCACLELGKIPGSIFPGHELP